MAKTVRMTCAPSEDLNQPGHLPRLTRVFAGRTGRFVGFVMLQLIYNKQRNLQQTKKRYSTKKKMLIHLIKIPEDAFHYLCRFTS